MKKCVYCGNTQSTRWYRENKYVNGTGHICNICYHKRHNAGRRNDPKELAYRKEYNKRPEVVKHRIEWQRNRLKDPAKRLYQASHKAKQRGLAWTISIAEYEKLISCKCFYCDNTIEPYGGGLDRINSALGYTPENVVPCCRTCNVMKNDLTQEEFFGRIQIILNKFKNPTTSNLPS